MIDFGSSTSFLVIELAYNKKFERTSFQDWHKNKKQPQLLPRSWSFIYQQLLKIDMHKAKKSIRQISLKDLPRSLQLTLEIHKNTVNHLVVSQSSQLIQNC